MLREHLKILKKLLFAAYLLITALSLRLSGELATLIGASRNTVYSLDNYILPALLTWGIVLWSQKSLFLYRSKSLSAIMKPVISVSFKASAIFLIYVFFAGIPIHGRFQVAAFLILNLIGLLAVRLSLNQLLQHYRKRGYNCQSVVIIGKGKKAKKFADNILARAKWGYNILGFLSPKPAAVGSAKKLWRYRDIPCLGTVDDLPEIIKSQQVDWVVFALENDQLHRAEPAITVCQQMGARAAVLANFFPSLYTKMKPEEFFDCPILLYETPKPTGMNLVTKEVFDRVAAATGIIILSPILILASFAIKLSSKSPILFKQKRSGLNGKVFTMYKFCTMVPDAENLKGELARFNEMDGPAFKMEHDPRITRVGKWLRKTSIDELPQLFNVLKGDMSLVGPRPPLIDEVKQYDLWHRRRLSIKPGITCLWQIMGRNNVNFEKWMQLDLEYIDNWSLWLDTKILARTIPTVLTGKGAR
jgi:exopolysaccharide biosynthesis polyprenyl glycosylphosphotransferase